MNTAFCPLLLAGSGAGIASASVSAASLTDSPFNSPLRSVQPRWARINHRLQQQQGTPTKTFSTTSLASPSNDALSGEGKKIASSSASCCDRFIPNRSVNDTEGSEYVLLINQQQHQQQKEQLLGSNAESAVTNEEDSLRVLSFSLKAPVPSREKEAGMMSNVYSQIQYPLPKKSFSKALASSNAQKQAFRSINALPFKVLDAPGILDDYYLNLLAWSSQNVLAVALGSSLYLWNASNGQVTELTCIVEEGAYFSSVAWSADGNYLSLGTNDGFIQVWDVETNQKLRTMPGCAEESFRIGTLAWNNYLLSSGCRGGYIVNHDTRVRAHVQHTLRGHAQEVCGLEWSDNANNSASSLLCSGGNDNLVNIWDLRRHEEPVLSFSQHQAAVKAVGWCPWQANVVATGGGSIDKSIKFWNTSTGSLLNSVDTGSQVCALKWSPSHRELVSSHGFADNQLMVWRYPSMANIARINAHSSRVLHLALSPDGTTVASAAGDETIKFWSIFEKQHCGALSSASLPWQQDEDSGLLGAHHCSPLSKVSESGYKKLKIR